jgi:hypothetical protein
MMRFLMGNQRALLQVQLRAHHDMLPDGKTREPYKHKQSNPFGHCFKHQS